MYDVPRFLTWTYCCFEEVQRKNCPNKLGGYSYSKGLFPLQKFASLGSLNCQASGALGSLFTELDLTEGKEGHQGLPGASSPSQLESWVPPAGGWTLART